MADGSQEFPAISLESGARYIPRGPLAPTPSGYVPGAPIIATPMLGEGLARLQAGESDFDLGAGTYVQFSGIPEGRHNVLRDLQESSLGKKANQLESMTIELVAMLFDFIFETKDLPDGIKALLARLQIPVLKAAMLDGAFFAKKNHPSRLLVNALADAGRGWSPAMGTDDPLYSHIDAIVHRILDGFTDNLAIFDEAREKLEKFLAEEEKVAEANIQSTAEEINQTDRREMASAVAKAEVERRIEMYPVPNFLATFLRQQWTPTLEEIYLKHGEESDTWEQSVAMLEDLVWSVQPKRTKDDRKHLVALLPSLLKRLSAALLEIATASEERERFMSNLIEAHAASVKPNIGAAALATASVVEQAKADGGAGARRRRRGKGSEGRRARRRDDAGRAGPGRRGAGSRRRSVPRDRAEPRARRLDRIRGGRRPARIREARLDQPVARHLSVHQSAGPQGAVDERRGARRSLPRGSCAARRGGAADRSRVRKRDGVVRREGTRARHTLSASPAERSPSSRSARRTQRVMADPSTTRIGVLVIGDEILSGKREDRHFAHVVATLAERGLAPAWARYEGDDRETLTRALRDTLARGDIVFSFGGVGATPDDHTRQAAAAALGVPLARHPEAVASLEAQFGEAAYPHRVLMAEFPQGATIIPNPVNRVASFSVGDHHFFPGFPQMAWPMLDWVLATRYRGSPRRPAEASARSSCSAPARGSCCR